MSIALRSLLALIFLTTISLNAFAQEERFYLPLDGGDELEISRSGQGNEGPLFIWLVNQYGEMTTPSRVIQHLTDLGAQVWRVDLLESLLLQRSSATIRRLDGEPVAALIETAIASGTSGPIVVLACDRMAAPLLRGLHHWQAYNPDNPIVAGGILLFPNLYRGTPIAGEEPELLGIVAATNMPIVLFQPDMGSNRQRLLPLLTTLHEAGSPAYAWLVRDVRDYYILRSEVSRNRALSSMAGSMPEGVRQAIDATPRQLLAAARLLAQAPRPTQTLTVDQATETPVAPAYGLVERSPRPAPDYDLIDARGQRHTLDESLGRVTLVNFWATWCPPCVHEIPSMNRLASAYEEDEFAIVSINFRETPEHILDFMRQVEVDFPVLMDIDGAISADWGVFAFPSSFILDRNGNIRYSVNTAIEWDIEAVREVIDDLRMEN